MLASNSKLQVSAVEIVHKHVSLLSMIGTDFSVFLSVTSARVTTVCFFVKFLKYYEHDEEILPALKLDPCLTASGDQVFLAEPLVWQI